MYEALRLTSAAGFYENCVFSEIVDIIVTCAGRTAASSSDGVPPQVLQ